MTDVLILSEGPAPFQAWPKIPRLTSIGLLVTEKLDGTNAHIVIPEDEAAPILAGSRSRYVTPEKDNFGFARWVQDNETMLRRLGPGRHYGEWYGAGIQRRYGLPEKRFALFNPMRWRDGLPEGVPVSLVPVLYQGPIVSQAEVQAMAEALYRDGSVAVPGWDKPEGIVIQVGGQRWKVTDAEPGNKHASKMDANPVLDGLPTDPAAL